MKPIYAVESFQIPSKTKTKMITWTVNEKEIRQNPNPAYTIRCALEKTLLVSKNWIEDENLTLAELGFLVYLQSLKSKYEDNFVNPTNKQIMARLEISKSSIRRYLSRLEKFGHLNVWYDDQLAKSKRVISFIWR